MSGPATILERTTAAGDRVWMVDAPNFGENRYRFIVVISEERLWYAEFVSRGSMDKRLAAIEAASDSSEYATTLKSGKAFALTSVRSLQALNFNQTLRIEYIDLHNRRRNITLHTKTTQLYQQLFDLLRQRVAPQLPPVESPAPVRRVITAPVLVLLAVLVFGGIMIGLAMGSARGVKHQPRVSRHMVYEYIMTFLAETLGTAGAIVVVALAVILVGLWFYQRIKRRPIMRFVEIDDDQVAVRPSR